MNEQLQSALLSILNSTINATTVAKDFLLAEIPDVIRQLLVWKAIESGIWFVFTLLSAGAAACLSKKIWAKSRTLDPNFPHRSGRADLTFGAVVVALLSLVLIVCSVANTTWLKILISPKVYLIEFAASLVK